MTKPRTVGELRQSGYAPRSVKAEIRQNLIRKLERGERLFPGIVGFDETVLPQIENALLSGQDLILLGERGQAKSRLARALVALLDEAVPALAGSEVNDDPLQPISKAGRELVAELGDRAPVEWLPRERRYGEKLATPDITIADLIGEVDPIKVAEGRYLADELTIHYGLLPRTHRGIFVLNELPDLAERIQVGLLNIMEERDVQIRGYLVRLPLDLLVVASANPEDYTNRGRIITPLKDRFGSQVRTHYPRTLADEIGIVEQEATRFASDGYQVEVPAYMQEIVAELTHLARRSPEISQRSGVSVRVSICNYENLVSNALRRAVRLREPPRGAAGVGPRRHARVDGGEDRARDRGGRATRRRWWSGSPRRPCSSVFNRRFQTAAFGELLEAFGRGLTWEVGRGHAGRRLRASGQSRGRLQRRDGTARRGRPSGPRRRRGGVRARGSPPEPEAQQGPRGRRAPVQGVRSRYSRWDGSQSLPDFDADDLLAAMADDLVADGDPRRALERLLRQGFRTRDGEQVPGLRDLLARLRRQRQASARPARSRRHPRRPPSAAAGRARHGAAGDRPARRRRAAGGRRAASRRRRATGRSSSASRPSVAPRWTRCRRIWAGPSAGSRTTSSSIRRPGRSFRS